MVIEPHPVYGYVAILLTLYVARKMHDYKISILENKQWEWVKKSSSAEPKTQIFPVGKSSGLEADSYAGNDVVGVYDMTNLGHVKEMINDAQRATGGNYLRDM